jgi:hypothetical protein
MRAMLAALLLGLAGAAVLVMRAQHKRLDAIEAQLTEV